MQRYAAVGIRAPCSVFKVSLDRTSYLRELGAYLVVASRQQVDLHERVVGRCGRHAVAQQRLLGFGARRIEGLRAVGLAVAQNPVAQLSLVALWRMLRNSPIGLPYGSVAYHLVEAYQRLGRFGEYYRAANRAVYAVHDAEKHLRGLVVAYLYHRLDLRFERVVALGRGLHQIAGMFVNDQQVVVFV